MSFTDVIQPELIAILHSRLFGNASVQGRAEIQVGLET